MPKINKRNVPNGTEGWVTGTQGAVGVVRFKGDWEVHSSGQPIPHSQPVFSSEAEAVSGKERRGPKITEKSTHFKDGKTHAELTHPED